MPGRGRLIPLHPKNKEGLPVHPDAEPAEPLKKRLKAEFLTWFEQGGALYWAAQKIGRSPDTIERWRKDDQEFDAAVVAADNRVTDTLKLTAYQRALKGNSKGADTLLMFLTKARDPRYRDHFDINAKHSGAIGVAAKVSMDVRAHFKGLSKEALQKLAEKL